MFTSGGVKNDPIVTMCINRKKSKICIEPSSPLTFSYNLPHRGATAQMDISFASMENGQFSIGHPQSSRIILVAEFDNRSNLIYFSASSVDDHPATSPSVQLSPVSSSDGTAAHGALWTRVIQTRTFTPHEKTTCNNNHIKKKKCGWMNDE